MLFDVQIHRAMHAITNAAQNENALNVKKNLFEFLLQMIVTITKKMKSEIVWTIDSNFQNDFFFAISYGPYDISSLKILQYTASIQKIDI